MSNSSAVAAARRRRAGFNEMSQVSSTSNQNQDDRNIQQLEEKLTPLQILKIHDEKLNDIELNLESLVSDLVNTKIQFHTDKIKELINENTKLKEELEKIKNNKSDIDNVIIGLKTELSYFKDMLINNQDKLLEISSASFKALDKVNELSCFKDNNNSDNELMEDTGISNMKNLFENLLKGDILSDNMINRDDYESDNDSNNELSTLNISNEKVEDLTIDNIENINNTNEISQEIESTLESMKKEILEKNSKENINILEEDINVLEE